MWPIATYIVNKLTYRFRIYGGIFCHQLYTLADITSMPHNPIPSWYVTWLRGFNSIHHAPTPNRNGQYLTVSVLIFCVRYWYLADIGTFRLCNGFWFSVYSVTGQTFPQTFSGFRHALSVGRMQVSSARQFQGRCKRMLLYLLLCWAPSIKY